MNRLPHEIHVTGELRLAGPLSPDGLVIRAYRAYHTEEEQQKIKSEVLQTIAELLKRETIFKWSDGRVYLRKQAEGAGPVPEPAAEIKPEGNEMAKKAGRPPKKATNDEPQVEAKNGEEAEEEEAAAPEGKFKDLETDGEVSDAMAIAENDGAKAKSELEVKSALRRIACAKRDYAILLREHLKISEGASVDDIRLAQKEVDKAEKVVVKASADRREAQAAYDAVNERISQILNRKLPLFD